MTQQEFGSSSRYEHARFDRNPKTGKLGPSNDLLQRDTAHSLPNHLFEVVRRSGTGQQHLGLVLGEYAAGQPKP